MWRAAQAFEDVPVGTAISHGAAATMLSRVPETTVRRGNSGPQRGQNRGRSTVESRERTPNDVILGTSWAHGAAGARCATMGFRSILTMIVALWLGFETPVFAQASVVVVELRGGASVKSNAKDRYVPIRLNQRIGSGARIRTGTDGQVTLRFPDRTRSRVLPNSEVLVRISEAQASSPSGVVLFFGRLWSNVVKSVSGAQTFEVRGANAVAGVRGTQFEVGVADDGSSRVVVSEGLVDVVGDVDEQPVSVSGGYMVDADGYGRLQDRRKAPESLDWDGWMSRRARALEQRGMALAKDLYGRLESRRGQVERLLGQQKRLRARIESLEQQQGRGVSVQSDLQDALRDLERVTQRLESMQRRLQAGFGMFGRWRERVASGRVSNARGISLLAEDIKRVEKGFADLFEEGTDQSEESLEEMMKDMKRGPTLRPKKKAKDELF